MVLRREDYTIGPENADVLWELMHHRSIRSFFIFISNIHISLLFLSTQLACTYTHTKTEDESSSGYAVHMYSFDALQ